MRSDQIQIDVEEHERRMEGDQGGEGRKMADISQWAAIGTMFLAIVNFLLAEFAGVGDLPGGCFLIFAILAPITAMITSLGLMIAARSRGVNDEDKIELDRARAFLIVSFILWIMSLGFIYYTM